MDVLTEKQNFEQNVRSSEIKTKNDFLERRSVHSISLLLRFIQSFLLFCPRSYYHMTPMHFGVFDYCHMMQNQC